MSYISKHVLQVFICNASVTLSVTLITHYYTINYEKALQRYSCFYTHVRAHTRGEGFIYIIIYMKNLRNRYLRLRMRTHVRGNSRLLSIDIHLTEIQQRYYTQAINGRRRPTYG